MGFFISTLHNKISSQLNNFLIYKIRVSIILQQLPSDMKKPVILVTCVMVLGHLLPTLLIGGKCFISARCL